MAESEIMPTHRYEVEKLLELRSSLSFVICPLEKINKHVDIASIFRLPDEAFNNPQRFSCSSRTLAINPVRHNFSQGSRRYFIESSEESEDRMSSSANSRREFRQYQWNFRRRESSDRSSQPHSAPTGIAAQQSENFQRFYRAVVSPTHLRVTAGGRIVPNTRSTPALPPPQFDWRSDKFQVDRKSSASEPHQNTMVTASPLNAVTNAFTPADKLAPQSTLLSTETDTGNTGRELILAADVGGEIGSTIPSCTQVHPIKISPPSQFDQSKPFMINGQIVYPVTQGFHPSPAAVPIPNPFLGVPSFLPPPQFPNGGSYIPTQFSGFMPGMPNVPGSFMFPGQQLSMMMPGLLPAEMMAPMYQYLPIQKVPLQQENLRAQMHQLQSQINFLDHQLTNNRHQIDEHATEAQKAILLSQARNMELMLEFQAAQDANVATGYPFPDEMPVSKEATVVPPVVYSTKPVQQVVSGVLQKKDSENTTTVESVEVASDAGSKIATSRAEPVVKSKLSMKAAPFRPRSQVPSSQAVVLASDSLSSNSYYGASTLNVTKEHGETQQQIEERLSARATSKYGIQSLSSPMSLSRGHTHHGAMTRNQFDHPLTALQRSNTINCAEWVNSNKAVPYLVGSLPPGVHSSAAKSSDFSYSRALTEEEVRARHLYWGKAPPSIQHGLPKFDGKDFYPPSPVKRNAMMSGGDNSFNSGSGHENHDYVAAGFATLFAEPGLQGCKTPTPTRSYFQTPEVSSKAHPLGSLRINGQGNRPPKVDLFRSEVSPAGWQENPVKEKSISHTSPSSAKGKHNGQDDFSGISNRHGVTGIKSSLAGIQKTGHNFIESSRNIETILPAASVDTRYHNEGAHEELWKHGNVNHQGVKSESDTVISFSSAKEGLRSSKSSMEFHPSPGKMLSPRSAHQKAFAERVENFRNSDVQTQFLQNMLKNVTQSGPVLSGAITSATAQGILPQYRGSAAASLTPTMLSHSVTDRDFFQHGQSCSNITAESNQTLITSLQSDILTENRPPQVGRKTTQVSGGSDESGAQGYMRYLNQKDEKKRMVEQAMGADVSTTLPGQRTDW